VQKLTVQFRNPAKGKDPEFVLETIQLCGHTLNDHTTPHATTHGQDDDCSTDLCEDLDDYLQEKQQIVQESILKKCDQVIERNTSKMEKILELQAKEESQQTRIV